MPRVSKRRHAAKAVWMSRKLASQSTAALLVPPPKAEKCRPEPLHDLELFAEDELESTVEIDIKLEPLEAGQDEQILQQDEMEVEVELLDPKDTCPAEEELDPIGQDPNQKLLQEKEENQLETRCKFCLKQLREASGRGAITQLKIEFVLGLREWGTPGTRPACCEGCRKMFELFYEFKRSCLVALARPAELLVWAGANKSAGKFVNLKPKIVNKAKIMERKSERPAGSKTKKHVQQKEKLNEGSKQKSLEVQIPSTEAIPTKLKQDIKKPSFECEICMEKFSDGLVLKKHWLNHFPTASNETVTKPTVRKRTTDLPISDAASNISAPEPAPSTAVVEDEEQKKTYCGRCRKWFSTKTIYIHHKPFCIKFQVRPEPAFVCSRCPQKFHRQQDLTLHINKHNGVRTIPCRRDGCTKMFFNTKARHTHEKLCGQDAQLICSVCGSLFRSGGALRIHLDTHGDPKFSCELCNKAFYTRANLKKHSATHSEERKFQCKVCGKRFKSYEANRVHQRIHTQEKPYECHICSQRFMYNCLLKTHLEKGHEPEEPGQPV